MNNYNNITITKFHTNNVVMWIITRVHIEIK